MNKFGLISALVISSVSFASSAQNVTDAFSVTNGEPSAQNCQLPDIGSTLFDPESGRLWACAESGWVYFESQMPNKYACLDVKRSVNSIKFKKGKEYAKGVVVKHENNLYKAKKKINRHNSWTLPQNAKQDWAPYAGENNQATRWNEKQRYDVNERVVYMGIEYRAKRWISSNRPGEHANWEYIGPFECPKS
ncbi:hypothetical protein [Vibrio nigripulchritudo]|uniref:hypothetical protein n=1 Tax=Vibrio nigripulchritudo TaxID=28173 RepID=UPI0003B1DF3D|nr:hypothetical protein [Vibrio nigripulchritudo]CCN69183.1 exported hypothetical protein [Vibrio nigripulchritudo SFn118]